MTTDKHYLWLDLETTGGVDGIEDHEVLELAYMVTTTGAELDVVDGPHSFLLDADLGPMVDPFVVEMHTNSGLMADLEAAEELWDIMDLEGHLLVRLGRFFADGLVLAGSGVSRFDRQFLIRDLPSLNRNLRYYEMDMATIRRAAQNLGWSDWLPTKSQFGDFAPGKSHRASQDVVDAWTTAKTFFANVEAARLCVSLHENE